MCGWKQSIFGIFLIFCDVFKISIILGPSSKLECNLNVFLRIWFLFSVDKGTMVNICHTTKNVMWLIHFEAIISLLELQDLPNWSLAFRFIPFSPCNSQNDVSKTINRHLTSLLAIVCRDSTHWSKEFILF